MIALISIFVIATVLTLNKQQKGIMFNVNTLFTVTWCICLMISSFGLYGLYIPSNYVYVLSFVAIIVFNSISSVKNNGNKDFSGSELKGICRYQLIYLLHIVAYIFVIPYLQASIQYIAEYGWEMLRAADQETLEQSSLVAHAMQWICLPLFNVTMICAAINLATKRKDRWPVIVFAVIDAAIYAVIYGGRYIIVKLLFYVVAAFVISEKSQVKYVFKKHKKVVVFAVLIILLLNYLTSLRAVSDMDFVGNIVVYFTGSFGFLSELLEKNAHGNYMGYGKVTFGFILNFLSAIGKILFGFSYKGTDAMVTSIVKDYLKIGTDITYNALPTVLYYFILDYGKVFWVAGMFMLSLFCHKIEDGFYRKKDWNSFCRYLFVLFTVFDTVLVYDYIGAGTFMTFVFIEFFTNSRCKIERISWK